MHRKNPLPKLKERFASWLSVRQASGHHINEQVYVNKNNFEFFNNCC